MINSHRRAIASIVGALLLIGTVSACTSTPSSSVSAPSSQLSFPEQLKAARAEATSDFERKVLDSAIKTGSISAADYEQAVSVYLKCTSAAGVTIDAIKQPNGIYKWVPQGVTDLNKYGEVTNKCADGTTMRIEGLYKLQVANPNMLSSDEAVVECFHKNNVGPKGYDAKQFDKDFANQFAGSAINVKSDLAQMCLNSLGYAVGTN
jgi:hypothetical protein